MGAFSSNRKRRVADYNSASDYNSSNSKNLGLNVNIDNISKKQKLSVEMNKSPVRHVASNSAISRLNKYPERKLPLPREVHAPIRTSRRFSSRDSVKEKELKNRLDETLKSAVASFRYISKVNMEGIRKVEGLSDEKKCKDVIELDKEVRKEDVLYDSSDDEVEILEIDGDEMKGLVTPGQKWNENDGFMENMKDKIDASPFMVMEDSAGKMLDKLSLNKESDFSDYKKLLEESNARNGKLQDLDFQIKLKEKLLEQQSLSRPRKKPESIKKDLVSEAFTPLTKEEEADVALALSNSTRRKLLVSHEKTNIDITGEKLQCLRPGMWLNDEVINVYLELLKERELREPNKFLKCHFFNTFFYKKVISGRGGYNFQPVRRWTSQKKLGYCLFDCDKIFVPIHRQVHWCLGVINKKDEKFQYLDSLGGYDADIPRILARYYVDEVKDKTGKDIDVSSWKQEFVEDLPEQENGFDCGVFMIKYADFYSRGVGLCFNQEHMPYFRVRTAKEILRLKAD